MLVRGRLLILGTVLLVAAVAVSGAVIAATKSPNRSMTFHTRIGAPFPPDQQELSDLRDVALSVAAHNGDPHPTSGRLWAASRSRATRLLDGTRADTDQPSYVMVLHGDFVTDAPRPEGTPAPTGTVMTMVLDPSTGEVMDFGVRNSTLDLTALGPGADLGVSG